MPPGARPAPAERLGESRVVPPPCTAAPSRHRRPLLPHRRNRAAAGRSVREAAVRQSDLLVLTTCGWGGGRALRAPALFALLEMLGGVPPF